MNENRLLQTRVSVKQKITLILFGLFLFFVLLEASLRLGGFILLSVQEHRNLQSIKQKGVYRILCLGESTTAGEYPRFLEQDLNQRNIGVRFSIINKGRDGTNTPIILSQVESYLNEYHPNLVVTMMGINDGGEYISFEIATTSKGMLLIRSFRTYKLARLLWLHILTKAKEIGVYKPNEGRWFSSNFSRIELKEDYAEPSSPEDAFKKALELNPENDRVYAELGWTYWNQGKISEGEDAFKKILELNPDNDYACVELGWTYWNQGKYSEAEDAFKKALELNPENYKACIGLGRIYHIQGKYSEAEDAFKKALELNPENDRVYAELGWTYWNQGKYPEAEDAFKKALELNPENDRVYAELGWTYWNQDKYSEAEDAFKRALELNPENDRVYGAISVLYVEIGKLELAEEYAQKANSLRLERYSLVTVSNYRKLKKILDKRGIRLVCVQYPMRNVEPLKKIFEQDEGIVFVDNESVFKEALKRTSYKDYFVDMFGGDFGHCTEKGNRLLAQHIAGVILKEVFQSKKPVSVLKQQN